MSSCSRSSTQCSPTIPLRGSDLTKSWGEHDDEDEDDDEDEHDDEDDDVDEDEDDVHGDDQIRTSLEVLVLTMTKSKVRGSIWNNEQYVRDRVFIRIKSKLEEGRARSQDLLQSLKTFPGSQICFQSAQITQFI